MSERLVASILATSTKMNGRDAKRTSHAVVRRAAHIMSTLIFVRVVATCGGAAECRAGASSHCLIFFDLRSTKIRPR